MGKETAEATLSDRQRQVLEQLNRSRGEQAVLVERARMVLLSGSRWSMQAIARRLGVDRQRVRRWLRRWRDAETLLQDAEDAGADKQDFEGLIRRVLSDRRRSGTPATFGPEQVTAIVALACEDPQEHGVPVSHWTAAGLTRVAVERGIVASISERHVARLLADADLRPHKVRYWLTSADKLKDPEQYERDVQAICDIYLAAPGLHRQGVHVVSTDERTGMQALARKYPSKPPRLGLVERREFEYKRHGTLCLMANLHVATGEIIAPSIGPSRSEADFLRHIESTVATDPGAGWVFIVDQLDTHMSESLVRFVGARCAPNEELGVKFKRGHLKSRATRKRFLSDPRHRIRFVYTPRHSSWLNQIEIWFSVLARRVLRRGNFSSTADLRRKVTAFIEYFNAVLAKPYKWTYTGRPLEA